MAQEFGPYHLHGKPQWSSLDSREIWMETWTYPGCFNHLENEPDDEDSVSLLLSLPLSVHVRVCVELPFI